MGVRVMGVRVMGAHPQPGVLLQADGRPAPIRTVADLMKRLSALPPDALVVVEDADTGYDLWVTAVTVDEGEGVARLATDYAEQAGL